MSIFRFKRFGVHNDAAAMKVGTDAVLLGAAMTLRPTERRLLDIGTGTGVVALLAAQRLEEMGPGQGSDVEQADSKPGQGAEGQGAQTFKISAIDIDGAAADEAALNFRESPWSANLQALNCALADFTPAERYDHIFSNPPFYDESLRNPDERKSLARHTSLMSWRDICLFAADAEIAGLTDSLRDESGKNGSGHLRGWLEDDGILSLILPSESEKELLRGAAALGLYPFRTVRIRTSGRKAPKRLLVEFSRRRCAEPLEEEINLQQPNCTAKYYL